MQKEKKIRVYVCFVTLIGVVMVAVVLVSRRFHINPDNVATPIACSLGDITTLSLLACISDFFYSAVGKCPI